MELKVSFSRLKGWKLEEGMFTLEIHAYEVIVEDLLKDNLLAYSLFGNSQWRNFDKALLSALNGPRLLY